MPLLEKYHDYFDIDPEYVSAINESVIIKNPDMWKKFFPHETFIRLLKNTVDVLERKQKLCLWVEGAYGTGKSHAVLTLKNLLDAKEEDTKEYFQRYNLDQDLYNRFQTVKTSGQILTVHRFGSSSIQGDNNLVFAIQESIEKALATAGIKNKGGSALKAAAIAWLSDKDNHDYFNKLITGAYSDLFGGDNVDDVLEKLNTYTGDALIKVMDNISKVGDDRHFFPLTLSVSDLANWIREIIRANGLKAIVFIWDEFSEYFHANAQKLTGFQELCEISETDPFYFVLVTHVTQGIFYERDQDYIKLNGRFVNPHSIISLPENIAFQLMGAAMKKNEDTEVLTEWKKVTGDLYDRTRKTRELVKAGTNITEKEMADILPIHPYAALLLRYISSVFDSNQRSMFDFIQNDRGDEIMGFQWFINNFGPFDENPFLTVDMLWDFFYEKGKENLSHDIRAILDYYHQPRNQKLDSDQKRVLKTVLLLQAISQRAGNAVELFISNEKNLDNAFEGSDLENDASRCAEQLVRDKVLYSKPLGGGKFQYAVYNNEGEIDLAPYIESINKKSASALITEELPDKTTIADAITPTSGALNLRYKLKNVSVSDFDSIIKKLQNTEEKYENNIIAVVCFAKDDQESVAIGKKIREAVQSGSFDVVFIDASRMPFGADGFETYCHDMALSSSQVGKDNDLATQYAKDAKNSLKKWRDRIVIGDFIVYSSAKPDGEHVPSLESLYDVLEKIDMKKFPECLEGHYNVSASMYTAGQLKQGVECACEQKTKGVFNSKNQAMKLENALEGAWEEDGYWNKRPNLNISKIKVRVEDIVNDGFKRSGRVSIQTIYDVLKATPYGFMPCNLSAFILGFVLKEYTSGAYSWSDGLTNDLLDVDKLGKMIDEVIKLEITPNPRYKDKYIVAVTEEEKAFNEITSTAFDVSLNLCTSVPNTRELVRSRMKEYSFPIWTLKSILNKEEFKTDKEILEKLIDLYCGLVNNNNLESGRADSDIAMDIGKQASKNPDAGMDLKKLFCKEKCTEAMAAYLETFDDGELVKLALEVGDGGQYVNAVRKKFDAEEANWVWNIETAQQKIREVILEYEIILESNKINSRSTSYEDALREWCDKCNHIRISYAAAKNDFGELEPFVGMLYQLKRSGTILDSQKQSFCKSLKINGEDFNNFYNNQVDLFKRMYGYYLVDLDDDDIREVYRQMPAGSFMDEKQVYLKKVEDSVQDYKDNLKSNQLKNLWKEKTGTDTPRAWSKIHKMPILCLIPDAEVQKARSAFGAINNQKPDGDSAEKALEYIESASFFDFLTDEATLDKIFKEAIIKNYIVMLPDVQKVKDYLDKCISSDPYYWFGLPEVDKQIRLMAEAEYNRRGYERALAKIENMDDANAKKYLSDLVKDNMIVGMEIIKGN